MGLGNTTLLLCIHDINDINIVYILIMDTYLHMTYWLSWDAVMSTTSLFDDNSHVVGIRDDKPKQLI